MHYLCNNIWQDDDGSFVFVGADGFEIKVTSKTMLFKDRYGNITTVDDGMLQYKQNSPTYNELYKHWLKTKQND